MAAGTTPRGEWGETLASQLGALRAKYGGAGAGAPLTYAELFPRAQAGASSTGKVVSVQETVDRIITRERAAWREEVKTYRQRARSSRSGRRGKLPPYLKRSAPTPQQLYTTVARELQENAATAGWSPSQVQKGLTYASKKLGTPKVTQAAAAAPAAGEVVDARRSAGRGRGRKNLMRRRLNAAERAAIAERDRLVRAAAKGTRESVAPRGGVLRGPVEPPPRTPPAPRTRAIVPFAPRPTAITHVGPPPPSGEQLRQAAYAEARGTREAVTPVRRVSERLKGTALAVRRPVPFAPPAAPVDVGAEARGWRRAWAKAKARVARAGRGTSRTIRAGAPRGPAGLLPLLPEAAPASVPGLITETAKGGTLRKFGKWLGSGRGMFTTGLTLAFLPSLVREWAWWRKNPQLAMAEEEIAHREAMHPTYEDIRRQMRIEQLVAERERMLQQNDPRLARTLLGLPELTPNEFAVGEQPDRAKLRNFILDRMAEGNE